jgi:membrane-bound metal-dependent hydrolase YbcI (DUF457 family)
MAQAGIHGLVGTAVRRWTPKKEWLMLGIVFGNLLPDMDALAVAYVTLTGGEDHGLHRTWSHSIFTIAGLILVFYIISALAKKPRIGNLGLGLGIGMLMHALLDLVIWFRGVEIFWPFYGEVNFWQGFTMPDWWYMKLESALEFLLIAVFFWYLGRLARDQGTDGDFLGKLNVWMWIEVGLFAVFLVLVYTWEDVFIPYGAVYILSLGLALGITARMRKTVDWMAGGSPAAAD